MSNSFSSRLNPGAPTTIMNHPQHIQQQQQQQQQPVQTLASNSLRSIVGGGNSASAGNKILLQSPPGNPNSGSSSLLAASSASSPAPSAPSAAYSSSQQSALQVDQFGISSLASMLHAPSDANLSLLSMGIDLTTLGLNLNASEMLYATFCSPCSPLAPSLSSNSSSAPTADYVLPFCYYMQPPALKTSHLTKFTLETLFYIFYNMPRDTLQVYAAKELYARDWRYHKDVKLWFTKTVKSNLNEKEGGEYVFFDVQAWETRAFRDPSILQSHKFLTESQLQQHIDA